MDIMRMLMMQVSFCIGSLAALVLRYTFGTARRAGLTPPGACASTRASQYRATRVMVPSFAPKGGLPSRAVTTVQVNNPIFFSPTPTPTECQKYILFSGGYAT